jgi:hypothetical protein
MAALFPKIYHIIERNPNKDKTLRWSSLTPTQGSGEQWDIFEMKPLDPPGSLSMLLFQTDVLYEMATPALRRQLLTEHLLVLHERVDKELVGRRFPRKKIQDILSGQVALHSPQHSNLLDEVLCELFQVQKVLIHRKTKSIHFFPPDLRVWKADRKVVFGEEDGNWVLRPTEDKSLLAWITEKEDQKWTIHWPTAEGKLEDMKAILERKQLTVHPALGNTKAKKDDYARVLGRSEAITVFMDLNLKIESI